MGLTESQRAILGIMLIAFSVGYVNDWGVICLYFLSYFYFHGSPLEITSTTNSIWLMSMVVPVIFCLFFSIKIAIRVGYVNLVKFCAVAYLIVPLVMWINFNFIMFTLCNLIIPASLVGLVLPPLFHCLYSHVAQNKSIATGIVVGSFSVGAIFWNILITVATNPNNTIPDIATNDPNLSFFSQQISMRVPLVTNSVYLSSSIMFLIGSFLVSANHIPQQQLEYQFDINPGRQIHQVNPQANNTNTKPVSVSNQPKQAIQSVQHGNNQQHIDVKYYLLQPIPLLLFTINITACLYQSYIQLNTKLVYMQMLQDDHLISVGMVIQIIASIFGGVLWGILADKKSPYFAILAFVVVDLLFKIYSSLIKQKIGFIVSMVMLGATDKTMLIMFGPTLVDCYGLGVATHLLPFKGLSGIIAIGLSSLLAFLFAKTPAETALLFMCLFSVANLAIGGYLAYRVKSHKQERQAKKYLQ